MAGLRRIYFDAADQATFVAWLGTRPAGAWHVLIGSEELPPQDIVARVLTWSVAGGADLVRWFVLRLAAGDITVRVSARLELPSGQPLS